MGELAVAYIIHRNSSCRWYRRLKKADEKREAIRTKVASHRTIEISPGRIDVEENDSYCLRNNCYHSQMDDDDDSG